MKYELLIKDILKHTKRAGLIEDAEELERALNIMRVSFVWTSNGCLKITFQIVCRLSQRVPMTWWTLGGCKSSRVKSLRKESCFCMALSSALNATTPNETPAQCKSQKSFRSFFSNRTSSSQTSLARKHNSQILLIFTSRTYRFDQQVGARRSCQYLIFVFYRWTKWRCKTLKMLVARSS